MNRGAFLCNAVRYVDRPDLDLLPRLVAFDERDRDAADPFAPLLERSPSFWPPLERVTLPFRAPCVPRFDAAIGCSGIG